MNEERTRRERVAEGGRKINITINLQPPTAQFIFPPHHFAVFSIFSVSPSLDGSSRKKRESFPSLLFVAIRRDLFPYGCWWCAFLLHSSPRHPRAFRFGQMRSRGEEEKLWKIKLIFSSPSCWTVRWISFLLSWKLSFSVFSTAFLVLAALISSSLSQRKWSFSNLFQIDRSLFVMTGFTIWI